MSEQTPRSASGPLALPDDPSLEWLRKQAKRRRDEMRQSNANAQLADAQFDLARQYGFASWRALKAHVDSLTVDGQLFEAARRGDVDTLSALLHASPDKLQARSKPYEWSLLHAAAEKGQLTAVDLLLTRGLDVNTREKGDNTYAMHWAAAAGHLDVVRRLVDAGGDVIGRGDDHELEVIGWATCWDGCDDDAHRAIVDLLIRRGARHHIFSAVAMSLDDELRRIVAADHSALERRMSRNENHQRPLHFAVRKNLPHMVALLLDLGADPLAADDAGYSAVIYATDADVDRSVMETIRARGGSDLYAALVLGDWDEASRIVSGDPGVIEPGGASAGALHLMSKRGDVAAVKWLLARGARPNARWSHWNAEVTPLHLAAWQRRADVVRLLLDAGADPRIRDSQFGSDAIGWAEHFGHPDIVHILEEAQYRR